MAVFVQLLPFIGSSSAILKPIDLSIGFVVYLNTTNHIEKDSCQNIHICGLKSHITANFARREVLYGSDAYPSWPSGSSALFGRGAIFIVDPCIDIWRRLIRAALTRGLH